jgi:hypothetical protein
LHFSIAASRPAASAGIGIAGAGALFLVGRDQIGAAHAPGVAVAERKTGRAVQALRNDRGAHPVPAVTEVAARTRLDDRPFSALTRENESLRRSGTGDGACLRTRAVHLQRRRSAGAAVVRGVASSSIGNRSVVQRRIGDGLFARLGPRVSRRQVVNSKDLRTTNRRQEACCQ